MGFFDKVSKGFSFIKQAYKMGFENRSLLKPSLYLISATIVWTILWAIIFIGLGIEFETALGKLLSALATFGSFLIFYFFMGMTVHLVDKHLSGESASMADAAQDARENFLAIGWLALVSTLVQMIANAARRLSSGKGVAALIGSALVGMVERLWTVATFLLLPIIIIEDQTFGDSIRRATDIHKRNLMLIGIGEVGVTIAANLLTFVVVLVLLGILYLLGNIGGVIGIIIAFIIGGIVLGMVAAFNVFVRMTYYTCLYHWAVAVEREGQHAAAPAILAHAL